MSKSPLANRGTRSSPERAHDLAAWFFVLIVLAVVATPALLQAVLDWQRDGRPTALELFTTVPGRDNLRALERRMDQQLWLGELGRSFWTPRVDAALERGTSKVVFGHGGWLFFRPTLRFVSGRGFESISTVRASHIHSAVTGFGQQLSERGKRLVFVPVPTKATVYPERVSKRARGTDDGRVNDPGVQPLFAALRASGVEVIDPLPVLLEAKAEGAEVFLPADTHWSWAGMLRVARQVALAIAPPRAANTGPRFDARRVRYEAAGDLYGMLGYSENSRAAGPRPAMTYEVWQTASTRDGQLPLHEGSNILVIGDSSVLVFSEPSLGLGRAAGFAERLAYAVDKPVDLLASPAAGTRQLQNLLSVERERLAAADTIVWVTTQRSFRFADDDWQPISLPALDAQTPIETPRDRVIEGPVAARIVALSEAPTRADYADCLMIVRYQTLEQPERSFDVAHVGWQDYAATRAAKLEVGDIVDLEITELPAARRLDRVCWVDDIGLDGAPLWATSYDVR